MPKPTASDATQPAPPEARHPDSKALDELRALILKHARDPARLAVLLALHEEGGTATYPILRQTYGMTSYFLDMHLKAMHHAGLLRYDGKTVEAVRA